MAMRHQLATLFFAFVLAVLTSFWALANTIP
jgi:hypothetical protein